MTSMERFRARVRVGKPYQCWTWMGSKNKKGYGQVRNNGKNTTAHRLAYELFVGPIPAGKEIDHLCKNRACVFPGHLEAVTAEENKFRSRKDRCMYGHLLEAGNLNVYGNGRRECRPCHMRRSHEQAMRNRSGQ